MVAIYRNLACVWLFLAQNVRSVFITSERETLGTLFYRGEQMPSAFFGLTPGCDPSTIGFDMFKFKLV